MNREDGNNIVVRNAYMHNLKNINVKIPKNQIVVFTGVSGSGKSTLAFDTIFAEGQRRYVESLSTYARQFLGQLNKPEVESIEGLSPAISIDQKSTSNNPRSTVGTITEIYDHLRLLYARIGVPHCPKCGREIVPQSLDEILDSIMAMEEGTKFQILAPIAKGKKGEFTQTFSALKQEGYARIRVDGEIYNLDFDEIEIDKNKKHNIEVVIDRIVLKSEARSRIADSVQIAMKKANGNVLILSGDKEKIYSEKLACPNCDISFDELEPRIFSFNAPFGACTSCGGLGMHLQINPDLVVPDREKSLRQGAIYPWAVTGNPYYTDVLLSVAKEFNIDFDKPFDELSQEEQNIILFGSGEKTVLMEHNEFGTKRRKVYRTKFKGVVPYLKNKYEATNSDLIRGEVEKYMTQIPCEKCHGARLNDFALSVTIAGKNIYEFTTMSIKEEYDFICSLFLKLDNYKLAIAKQLLEEIRERLKFLVDVGLDYLSLARQAGTLSGGEAQRIRLATQIGSGLSGVLYVLDEPSIGLHQVNNEQLLKTLIKLRNLGNTLIVVEHDEETIRMADRIIDIGPKAGVNGGKIVAQGSVEDIIASKNSITGKYLSGAKSIKVPSERRKGNGEYLKIIDASLNNLKNISVDIPMGVITTVTGVSGSGKSSLIFDILNKYAIHKLRKNVPKPQGVGKILGFEHIDKVIDIDQSPIGRTPRSNPATYTGVFDHIRDLFAQTTEAKTRGYKPGRFSFNVKGGRCEACSGDGIVRIEMNFLSDIYIPCDICKGKRYNSQTLEVKYKGKSIADVLDMTVKEALEFFENIPRIASKLQTLNDVGLDYMKLGQSATTLSGGEAQRVKLATELTKRNTGKTLYLLDEPSVGLHWYDLDKLNNILQKLADLGNTIVIIEHNMDLIKTSDYIIDLGPDGGDMGGTIVAQGTPEEVAKVKKSYTGQYLRKMGL
ncbi:MAG: excinuclease ABC subunit UvrA [bacterium]|nr:excinuclease ABC subunit UvrA [bacterium]